MPGSRDLAGLYARYGVHSLLALSAVAVPRQPAHVPPSSRLCRCCRKDLGLQSLSARPGCLQRFTGLGLHLRLTPSVSFTCLDGLAADYGAKESPVEETTACDCSLCSHHINSYFFARQTFQFPPQPTSERREHLSSTSTFALRIQDSQPIHQIQPRHNSHASKGYQKRGVQERGEGAYQDSSGELDSNPALQSVAYVALIY
jgi:hypothetical protein